VAATEAQEQEQEQEQARATGQVVELYSHVSNYF
jgi:hypothetical protein